MKKYRNIPVTIEKTIKKYLTWYIFPLIYFAITGLVCVSAWYSRPAHHRDGIKIIFKTISLIPALIWTGVITFWAGIIIIVLIISFQLIKRYPDIPLWAWTERLTLLTCVSTWSPTIYTNRKTVVIAYPGKSSES
jgi:hypothetical protein